MNSNLGENNLEENLERDRLKNLKTKSKLEQTIAIGINGAPELKHEEKMHHLGVFRERVLKLLTKGQVMENKVYQEIIKALQDPRASRMLIHGDIPYKFRIKYQKAAKQFNKPYTIIHDPELKGAAGLIIASDQAVDVENIYV